MATMTCPKCGTPNRPNAKFCAKCRAPLSAPSVGAAVPPPAAPPPPPVTPRQPPAAPPPPPPVTPRQPPAPPPPPPRQPPQAARPAARRGLFTRGRIISVVIGIMLLCLCVVLAFALSRSSSLVAQLPTTPTFTQPIAASSPTPLTPSHTLQPTTPASAPTSTATSTLTAMASATPTSKPPSATPTSTPTATQKPTAMPAASPTTVQPTGIPTDTAAGSVLRPGESWRVGTQVMTLQNPHFAGTTCGAILEFEVVFENTDAREVVVSLRGQEWKVTDEHNQPYEAFFWQDTKPTDCNLIAPLATLDKPALAAHEKYQVGLQVRGKLADNVNRFQFIVTKAGRITDAKWEITVPR
jgi:hypothetical protein